MPEGALSQWLKTPKKLERKHLVLSLFVQFRLHKFSGFFLRHKNLLPFKLLSWVSWEQQLLLLTKYSGHSPEVACIWCVSNLRNKYRAQAPTKETSSSQTSSHQLQESALTPSSSNTDRFAWLVIVMKLIKVPREAVPQHPSCSASCNNHFHLSQNGSGQKGSLQVTQPSLTAKAGSPWAPSSGLCPDGFWMSPRNETPQPLRATSVHPHSKVLPHFLVEFLVHLFLPITSHPVTWHYQEEPGCENKPFKGDWEWLRKGQRNGRGHLSNWQVWWRPWTQRSRPYLAFREGHIGTAGRVSFSCVILINAV